MIKPIKNVSNTFICIIFSIRLVHAAQVSRSAWTNKRGRQTQTTAINFPRINVSLGQRLLFIHQFSIPFHSATRFTLRFRFRKRIFRPRNRTGISSKASLAEGDVSICGDRARSYVADLRQTRLPHLHGNIIIPRLSRTDTLNLPCQTCGFHAADEKPGRRGVFYRLNLTNGCCKFVQRFCRAQRIHFETVRDKFR